MMPWPLGSYKSINEIRSVGKLNGGLKNQKNKREAISICIIDDEDFHPRKNLSSYGYQIRELEDISDIDDVKKYEIVLCDLMGVGEKFDPSTGGVSIIKEIKKNFPSKFVLAYSGATARSNMKTEAEIYSDDFIRKDADLDQWVALLDKYIDYSLDPSFMWKLTRKSLFEMDVDIKDVVILEDAYVRSINEKDAKFSKLHSVMDKMSNSSNIKGVVQSLIASAIYSVVFS